MTASFPPKNILTLLLSTYFILALAYASVTPAWQAPDEPAHYNVIVHIARTATLPQLVSGCYNQAYLTDLTSQKFPPHLSIDPVCYQHYQPPLYYLLARPLFGLFGESILPLRLLSVVLGGLSLFFAYRLSRFFFQPSLALAATAVMAFIPQHLSMLSAINNDSLAELLLLALLYVLLGWHFAPAERPLPWLGGILLGLILITKVTAYIAVPLGALLIWWAGPSWRVRWRNAWRLYLPAGLIALPLYLRNAWVYGQLDILGLARHEAVVVGQLRTSEYIAQVGWLNYLQTLGRDVFNSFWGQFGWMAVPMDSRVYWVLQLVCLLAVVGWVAWLGQAKPFSGRIRLFLLLSVSHIALVAFIFIGLNLSFRQFQGRYFFPALWPLSLYFVLGLRHSAERPFAWWSAGLLAGLTAVNVVQTAQTPTGVDKWRLLLGGAASGSFVARWFLRRVSAGWVLVGVCFALAGLAAVAPWWFIGPNL